MNITLKGDQVREFADGMTAGEIAREISGGLYRAACAASIDGKTVDLRTPISGNCALSILTFEDEEGKKAFWHTASHIPVSYTHLGMSGRPQRAIFTPPARMSQPNSSAA